MYGLYETQMRIAAIENITYGIEVAKEFGSFKRYVLHFPVEYLQQAQTLHYRSVDSNIQRTIYVSI